MMKGKLNFTKKLRFDRITNKIRMPKTGSFAKFDIKTGNNWVFYGVLLVILGTMFMPFLLVQAADKVQTVTYSSIEETEIIWQYEGLSSLNWDNYASVDYTAVGQIFRYGGTFVNFTHSFASGTGTFVLPSFTENTYKVVCLIMDYTVSDAIDDGLMYVKTTFETDGTYAYADYSWFSLQFQEVGSVTGKTAESYRIIDYTDGNVANDGVNDFENITGNEYYFPTISLLALDSRKTNECYLRFEIRNELWGGSNTITNVTFDLYGTTTSLTGLTTSTYDKATAMIFVYAIGNSVVFFYALNIFHFKDMLGKINLHRKKAKHEKEKTRMKFGFLKKKRRWLPW